MEVELLSTSLVVCSSLMFETMSEILATFSITTKVGGGSEVSRPCHVGRTEETSTSSSGSVLQ